jgi:type I restriction enzyme M protein
VSKADIAAQGYDLGVNRYKEVVHHDIAHRSARDILTDLEQVEIDIQRGIEELGALL